MSLFTKQSVLGLFPTTDAQQLLLQVSQAHSPDSKEQNTDFLPAEKGHSQLALSQPRLQPPALG
jgi:hypothetical protein